MKRIGILILSVFGVTGLAAQHNLTGGMLPKINFSEKISEKVKLVQSIESRQHFFSSEADDGLQYDYILTDVTSLASFKIQTNQSVNAGYMIRFRGGQIFHRLIQQYNLVHFADFFRVGHRLATDQTFSAERETQYRIRYRFTIERSLSGAKVDPGEFYVKVGNEYLWETSMSDRDFEIRLVPVLGLEISKKSKVEAGLDYRVSSFATKSADHFLRASMTWYQSF